MICNDGRYFSQNINGRSLNHNDNQQITYKWNQYEKWPTYGVPPVKTSAFPWSAMTADILAETSMADL